MEIVVRVLLVFPFVLPLSWAVSLLGMLMFGVTVEQLLPELNLLGEVLMMLLMSGISAYALYQRKALTF